MSLKNMNYHSYRITITIIFQLPYGIRLLLAYKVYTIYNWRMMYGYYKRRNMAYMIDNYRMIIIFYFSESNKCFYPVNLSMNFPQASFVR